MPSPLPPGFTWDDEVQGKNQALPPGFTWDDEPKGDAQLPPGFAWDDQAQHQAAGSTEITVTAPRLKTLDEGGSGEDLAARYVAQVQGGTPVVTERPQPGDVGFGAAVAKAMPSALDLPEALARQAAATVGSKWGRLAAGTIAAQRIARSALPGASPGLSQRGPTEQNLVAGADELAAETAQERAHWAPGARLLGKITDVGAGFAADAPLFITGGPAGAAAYMGATGTLSGLSQGQDTKEALQHSAVEGALGAGAGLLLPGSGHFVKDAARMGAVMGASGVTEDVVGRLIDQGEFGPPGEERDRAVANFMEGLATGVAQHGVFAGVHRLVNGPPVTREASTAPQPLQTQEVPHAESTGAEAGTGSGPQGPEGGAQGPIRLRDNAQGGLEAQPGETPAGQPQRPVGPAVEIPKAASGVIELPQGILHRDQMPQIKSQYVPEFLRGLQAKGVAVTVTAVPAGEILPTQVELNLDKVRGMREAGKTADNRPVIMSSDNHILDGHHRWAQDLEEDPSRPVRVYRVDLPIGDLLNEAKAFPKTTYQSAEEVGRTPDVAQESGSRNAPSGSSPGVYRGDIISAPGSTPPETQDFESLSQTSPLAPPSANKSTREGMYPSTRPAASTRTGLALDGSIGRFMLGTSTDSMESPQPEVKPATAEEAQVGGKPEHFWDNIRYAKEARPEATELLRSLADGLPWAQVQGGQADIKTPQSAAGKIKHRTERREVYGETHGAPAGQLNDWLRGRVTFRTFGELREMDRRLKATGMLAEAPEYAPLLDQPKGGFRSVYYHVRLSNGHTMEVQFTPDEIQAFSDGPGHKLYEDMRRKHFEQMTPEEMERYWQADQKMQVGFDEAWGRFLDRQNAAPRLAESDRQLQAQASRGTPSGAIPGRPTRLLLGNNHEPVPAQYALVDFDQLKIDTDRGQNRNANSVAAKIGARGERFYPEGLVSTTPWAQDGPPTVLSDGEAVGGNTRAKMVAYLEAHNPAKWEEYKRHLAAQAPSFGLDPAEVNRMRRPVLVRVVDRPESKQDLTRLVVAINTPTTSKLSTAEQAAADASLLPDTLLDSFQMGEGEAFRSAIRKGANAPAMQTMIRELFPDMAGATDTGAQLSRGHLDRMEAAIIAKGLGAAKDSAALEGMLMDPDPGVQTLKNALLRTAGRLAKARSWEESRAVEGDPIGDLSAAIEKFASLKQADRDPAEFAAQKQGSVFGDEASTEGMTPEQLRIIGDLAGLSRSPKKTAEYIEGIADRVLTAPHKGQAALFRHGEGQPPRRAGGGGQGRALSSDGVSRILRPHEANLGVKARVVDTLADVPEPLRRGADGRVTGIFDPHTGEVYVISSAVRDAKEAVATLYHEGVAHGGLRALLSEERLRQVMDGLWRHRQADIEAHVSTLGYGFDLGTESGKRRAAEEFVAGVAEKPEALTLGWFRRIVAEVRARFRRVAPGMTWTDEDIRLLLAKARGALQREDAARLLGGAPQSVTMSGAFTLHEPAFRRAKEAMGSGPGGAPGEPALGGPPDPALNPGLTQEEAPRRMGRLVDALKRERILLPDELRSKDITGFGKTLMTPQDIADHYAEAKPFYDGNTRGDELKSQLTYDLAEKARPYLGLGKAERQAVNEALLRAEGQAPVTKAEEWSRYGLTGQLAEAAQAVRDTMQWVKDDLRRHFREESEEAFTALGYPPDKAAAILGAVESVPDPSNLNAVLDRVAKVLRPIEGGDWPAPQAFETEAEATTFAAQKKGRYYVKTPGGQYVVSEVDSPALRTALRYADALRAWDRTITNYVPHRRYGNLVVRVFSPKGEELWAGRAENRLALRQLEARARDRFAGQQVSVRLSREGKPSYESTQGIMPLHLGAWLNGTKLDPGDRANLQAEFYDAIRARGFGASQIHRMGDVTGVEGFEPDLLRPIADYLSGYAGWRGKTVKLKLFSRAFSGLDPQATPKLLDWARAYSDAQIANAGEYRLLKGLMYHWYLGWNLKSALVNATQQLSTGWPELGMVGKGPLKQLARATADLASGHLTGEERQALTEAERSGHFGADFAAEITGAKRNPMYGEALGSWNAFLRSSSVLFSGVERANRKAFFLAALRMTGDPAKAAELTDRAHFKYGVGNRPEVAGGWRQPFFIFRSWAYNYFTMLKNHGEGTLSGEEKAAHAAAIARMTAAALVLGGLGGTGMGQAIRWGFRKAFGKDPEDILRAKAGKTASRLAFRGVPAALGMDISGSLDPNFPANPQEASSLLLGPLQKAKNAGKDLSVGQYGRAVEDVAPEVVRNPMAAWRLYHEGNTQRGGSAPITALDENGQPEQVSLSPSEALIKAGSFQPTRMNELAQEGQTIKAIEAQRSDAVRGFAADYVKAYAAGDQAAMAKVLNEVVAYNAKMQKEGRLAELVTRQMLRSAIRGRLVPARSDLKQGALYRQGLAQ